MNILIIGSKGFIGSNLSDYLSAKGHEVFGADVVVDYVSKNYYLIDATNADFKFLFELKDYDVCINCSGAASVPESLKNPLRDYHLNTANVYQILDSIRTKQPNCKFINLSSAAVYGNPEKLPISETDKINIVSPYGAHKFYAEQACDEFHKFYGLKTCSLRIFSAYGNGLTKQLFWDLSEKAKINQNISLFGTGNESRDFIFVNDLIRSIELSMLNSHFEGDVINIANGEEIFIKDATRIFFSFFPNPITFEFEGQERSGDPINWIADISRLKEMGYSPEYDIETGLKSYFDWINKIQKN